MILSVDPGKRCGWCKRYPITNASDSGVMDGDDVAEISLRLQGPNEYTLVIEDQFAKRYIDSVGRPRTNIRGLKTLIERRCNWTVPAQLYGTEVVLVHPSTWQSFFKIPSGAKHAESRKSLMNMLASNIAGRPVEADEDAAVLIGEWYRLTGGDSGKT